MSALPEPQTPKHRNHAMGNRVVCATPRRGKELSNYSLGDRLGKGAFATVFKAIHLRTAQVAAIKQIPLEKIKSVDTIMEEIELLQDLEHPNIVKYFGFMKDEMYLNIVLEYCENGSLAMILHKFGRFPENLVAQYMRQVLEGLAYLHQQGIIHRDIKGANILTTKEGIAKLADFGVAMRIVDGSEQTERPRAVGTPHWMAPEIIQMQEPSTACDIWSLGATIVELKTGQPPYGERQDIPAMYAIVQQESTLIVPTDSSGSLRDFLTLCFEKTPALRVSAQDLLKHLWIRKFGGDMRDEKVVNYPEQAVREWNSPSRRNRLAVPSILNLKSGLKRGTIDTKTLPPNNTAIDVEPVQDKIMFEETYENDFASLSFFERNNKPKLDDKSEGLFNDKVISAISATPVAQPRTPPAKRKHLSEFIETSSSLNEYEDLFEDEPIKPVVITDKSESSNGSSKIDPFLGLEDLLEDEPNEKVLCAQQEASELIRLITFNKCNITTAYRRLTELVISVPAVRQTLDQSRLLPKSLSIHTGRLITNNQEPEAIVAFLHLLEACICVDMSSDFITNFCIAGGLSFVLAQSNLEPCMTLRLLHTMSDISLKGDDKMAIARQLAFREDAIAVVCSFFDENSKSNELMSASDLILDMFKVCGSRYRSNLWHHFNAYNLFTRLVGLLHLPCVLENSADNRIATNFYQLVVSFSRNPQELLVETVNHKVLRRLMRAYIKLPAGSPHRTILLEFFKNASTLVAVLDNMQKGNVAPHLIAALRRAMHDERISSHEAHTAANCLVPTLFNYSRINRSRQREVARYGLLSILQDCAKRYPRLREFTFPIFSSLVHAGHDECWRALWEANALESFIELITESGWQAMAIAAVAAWIQAQPQLVGPKFTPHVGVINDTLLSAAGSTFESVISAVASLLYQNRFLCERIPIHGLFNALKKHITKSNTHIKSASLVQCLQIILWVLTANTEKVSTALDSSGLLGIMKELEIDNNTPVPCIKLIRQITTISQHMNAL